MADQQNNAHSQGMSPFPGMVQQQEGSQGFVQQPTVQQSPQQQVQQRGDRFMMPGASVPSLMPGQAQGRPVRMPGQTSNLAQRVPASMPTQRPMGPAQAPNQPPMRLAPIPGQPQMRPSQMLAQVTNQRPMSHSQNLSQPPMGPPMLTAALPIRPQCSPGQPPVGSSPMQSQPPMGPPRMPAQPSMGPIWQRGGPQMGPQHAPGQPQMGPPHVPGQPQMRPPCMPSQQPVGPPCMSGPLQMGSPRMAGPNSMGPRMPGLHSLGPQQPITLRPHCPMGQHSMGASPMQGQPPMCPPPIGGQHPMGPPPMQGQHPMGTPPMGGQNPMGPSPISCQPQQIQIQPPPHVNYPNGQHCPLCHLYTAPGPCRQCACNRNYMTPPLQFVPPPAQQPWMMGQPGLPQQPMAHGQMPFQPHMMQGGFPRPAYAPAGYLQQPPHPQQYQPQQSGMMHAPQFQPPPPHGYNNPNMMYMPQNQMMMPTQPGFMPQHQMLVHHQQMHMMSHPPMESVMPHGMSVERRQGLLWVPSEESSEEPYPLVPGPRLPNPDHVHMPNMMEYLDIAPRVGRTVRSVLNSEVAKEQERASRHPARSGAEGDAASSRCQDDGKADAVSDGESDDGIRVIHPACGRAMDDDEVCLFEGGLPPTRHRRNYDVNHLRVAERNLNLQNNNQHKSHPGNQ